MHIGPNLPEQVKQLIGKLRAPVLLDRIPSQLARLFVHQLGQLDAPHFLDCIPAHLLDRIPSQLVRLSVHQL